jgi:MFS transporter
LLTPYWVTLIPTTIAILLLWRMHDPKVERTAESLGTISHHVRSAVRNITSKKWLGVIFIALAFVTAGRFIWYEYYQLYAIEQYVLPVLFGILLALIHVGNLLGAEIAHRVKSPTSVLAISFACMAVSTASLAVVSGSLAIIIFLVICFVGSQACSILFDESLQHQTSSELRATTLSLAGLASRVIFGISAAAIIFFDSTPKAIAFVTLVVFFGIAVCVPVCNHLNRTEEQRLTEVSPPTV